MTWLTGTIDPSSTTPALDISKIKNDLSVLRAVIGGTVDLDVPFRLSNALQDTSGNIGIGRAPAANYRLDVLGGVIRATGSSTGSGIVAMVPGTGGRQFQWESVTGGFLRLFDASISSEYMRVNSSGDHSIGTVSNTGSGQAATLTAAATGAKTAIGSVFDDPAGAGLQVNYVGASAGNAGRFRWGGSVVGSISVTSTATAYNTSSDYRLKENVQPLLRSGEFVDALRPRSFTWRVNGEAGAGFLAHELQAVSPSSVTGEKDAVDADGVPVHQAVDYSSSELIANMIAEIQALRLRVSRLESVNPSGLTGQS